MKSLDRNKWFKYIKLYEEFNRGIPEELKTVYQKMRNDIGTPNKSFRKLLNLNDYDFVNLIVDLDVNFTTILSDARHEDRKIKYYSNFNTHQLFEGGNKIKIYVYIEDISLDSKKLCSLLAHELRHIYDIYTIREESDMKSFTDDLHLQILRKEKITEEFNYFLHLMYLCLEHELVARNAMIYENFINCYLPYEELKQIFTESYLYESFVELKNFDYGKVINSENIINLTNYLIDKIGGKKCLVEDDIKNFYFNWHLYFNKKCDEYLLEADKTLKEICLIEENQKYKNKKFKDIISEIYWSYIA